VSVTAAQIEKVLAEIKEAIQGGSIQKVRQRTKDSLVLTIRNEGRPLRLLISAGRKFCRIHSVSERSPSRVTSPFLQSLRKRLEGGIVKSVRQEAGERVVVFQVRTRGEEEGERLYRLAAELTGTHSNVVLVGEDGRVVSCMRRFRGKRRTVRPGERYEPPPGGGEAAARLDEGLGELAGRLGSYNRAVEGYYAELEAQEELEAGRRELGKKIGTQKARFERLIVNLRRKAEGAKKAEEIRLKGELLKGQLSLARKGMKEVAVPNYMDGDGTEVRVELDPRLSPQENLERYFKRYKKMKAGATRAEEEVSEAEEKVRVLEEVERSLEEKTKLSEVEEVAEECYEEGLLPRPREKEGRGEPRDRLAPMRFASADEMDLLVGRNTAQNDHLILHLARGNALWFHVEGGRGSHVVVRVPKGKTVPQETLLDAGNVALHFSKMRKGGAGYVNYTQCKYVRKPKGSAPGHVTYSNSKSLYITLDQIRLERIFQTRR